MRPACSGGVLPFLVGVGLCGATSACRTPCNADEPAGKEQIAREQKAVFRGQGICKELVTPSLYLTGENLVLKATKENVIATRGELPSNEPGRIEPLQARLKQYKEHFRAVRAAEPFQPTLYATLDPGLEPTRAISVLATAAHTGYAHMRLYAGEKGDGVEVDWWLPPPERSRAGAGAPPPTALCVVPAGERRYAVSLRKVEPSAAPGTSTLVERASVASAIERTCEGRAPCADLLVVGEARPPDSFGAVLELVSAAFKAKPLSEHRLPIVLAGASAPSSGPWAEVPLRQAIAPCAP